MKGEPYWDSDAAAMCNTCIQSRPKAYLTEDLLETLSSLIVEGFSDSPPKLAVCTVPQCVHPRSAVVHQHVPLQRLAVLSVRFIYKCLPQD